MAGIQLITIIRTINQTRTMRKLIAVLTILLASTLSSHAQVDAEGCKDPLLFPTRMPNYFITECQNNFDAVEFHLAAGAENPVTKEGTKTRISYDFNFESGKQKPSALQILRNYEAAFKKIGGQTQFLSAGEGKGVFKLVKSDSEVWVKIELVGNDNSDNYVLTILEVEAMKQEVTSDDILNALNTDGRIALYINFETGKSEIKPESKKAIDEITAMLKANPALKVSIEGHTDNVGNSQSNQTLSENRAKAVMNEIVSNGIDKTRLVSKGWGQTKPIDDNKTEEGKAKNRRVEVVKL
jgi:OmpA-OmpF porin, OOP family